MDKDKILRINELAKKKRTVGLTEQELDEQQALRQEYLDAFRANMVSVLDNTSIQETDGSKRKLEKKRPN